MANTKVDLNHNKAARIENLDELAAILFPNNKGQQRIFLAIFIELKWSQDQFLPALDPLAEKHEFSLRTLETVRSKMRRLGIIDHVSRFDQKHGYREGWVFSNRFARSLNLLAELFNRFREPKDSTQEKRDRDLFRYL